ncbi:EAL domain-containing protein [Pseudohongiella sp.]|uniref:EAL domain-containing protein n=1 Tax=marine sediment metagenome TaxID=412755 RepID=A0A0F9WGU1_9ZZZZ|nr:EAL domain-containing protein [Pseudohongiella sp.]HDZ09077.1 EAL domain-containing protein [Pseudohongiella sp.]HEA63587.1 EAL domain-containing protein [Pseudohongiella sp.]
MARTRRYISMVNTAFGEFYRLSAELQILVCIVLWVYIAILMRLAFLGGGLPSDFGSWIALVIFLVGLVSGPIVATVTALVCAVLMSPGGVFAGIDNVGVAFWVRTTGLFVAGLSGGLLQRLIKWLQAELYAAQHQVAGTDLPNIKATIKHLEKVLKSGSLTDKDLDVLNVRLNNLDQIRQSAGQDTVNQLVRSLAEQLQTRLGAGAYVSQLSGNELLGIQAGQGREISDVQKLVKEVLATPIKLDGEEYSLTATTGLHRKRVQGREVEPQSLLDNAAKMAIAAHRSNEEFQASPTVDAIHNLGERYSSLQIQAAMENHEITLHYEPRLNTRTGYFSALQGVVRWKHPRRGELQLEDFKAMLEEVPAIQGFCAWMLKLAFTDAEEWAKKDLKFRVTVDVTINDVLSAPVLAYALAESIKRKYKPGWLAIEVSEKSLRNADAKTVQYLQRLQSHHVSVVVSNFGDGGSTVQDMFMMPVDGIKFSAKLIEAALVHSDQRRQLAAMVKLIHSRGLVSVADGVRNSAGLRMLRTLACEELQGPLLSKALPKESIPWARLRV